MGSGERSNFAIPSHFLHQDHVAQIGPAAHVFLWLWRHIGSNTRRSFGGLLFDGERFNIPDLVQTLGISNSTARSHLKRLADAGYLVKIPAGRGGLRAALCIWHPDDKMGPDILEKLKEDLERTEETRQKSSVRKRNKTRQKSSAKTVKAKRTRQKSSIKKYLELLEKPETRQVSDAKIIPPLKNLPYREIKNCSLHAGKEQTPDALHTDGSLTVLPGGKIDWGEYPILREARRLMKYIPASDRPDETNGKLASALLNLESIVELSATFDWVSEVIGRKQGVIQDPAAYWAEMLRKGANFITNNRKQVTKAI
jgi:hypothetical protein